MYSGAPKRFLHDGIASGVSAILSTVSTTASGECLHTAPMLLSVPRALRAARRQESSLSFEQGRLDLLPSDNASRILLVAGDTTVEFGPLRVRQWRRVRLEAFPEGVKQLEFFRRGKIADFVL